MASDERARHELFVRLEQVLGAQEAARLMEHLPPVGWADVATKRDLDHLRLGILHDVDERLTRLERHLTTLLVTTVSGSMVAITGLAFAAAKLL